MRQWPNFSASFKQAEIVEKDCRLRSIQRTAADDDGPPVCNAQAPRRWRHPPAARLLGRPRPTPPRFPDQAHGAAVPQKRSPIMQVTPGMCSLKSTHSMIS